MIQIAALRHEISGSAILSDINLTLPRGKITAFIGPNGAGKSTLLNAVGRQIEVSSGQVSLDGVDLRQIAVVAQHLTVGSRIRVVDLIGFGRWPHAQGRPTPQDQQIVDRAIEEFDLCALRHRFLDELSGGQRQRAFIAMAYAQDTDWLLLDEPLNNLDLKHARSLMERLRVLVDHAGKSAVIVLHDLNYTLSWADHVVALRDGQIVFSGATAEVATARALSDLYDTKIQIDMQSEGLFARHHR